MKSVNKSYPGKFILLFIFIFAFCKHSYAVESIGELKKDSLKKSKVQLIQLEQYEDNLLGYTFEDDDKSFINFTLSLRTKIFPVDYLLNILPDKFRPDLHLHFAFTAGFGQYAGTRYSNPVVEKRFNPYLFFEYSPKKKFKNVAVEFGYGHESNGQSIDDSASFYKTAALRHNNIDETKDKISRGWDYYATSVKINFFPKKYENLIFESTFTLKNFVKNGVLQGRKEEYHEWERDWKGKGYMRDNVAGIVAAFTCYADSGFINKIKISYETGIVHPFTANTIAALVALRIGNFPLSFFYRYGYNGDLAQYGKVNSSFCIASLIPSFGRPENRSRK